MSNVNLNNPEFQLFTRLCDDIHRIANQIAPDETSDTNVFSQIAAAYASSARHLEEVLGSGNNPFNQQRDLRGLITRWQELANEYIRKQDELDTVLLKGKEENVN